MTSIDFLCTVQNDMTQYVYRHSENTDLDRADPSNTLTVLQMHTKDYTYRPVAATIPNPRPCRLLTIPDLPRIYADTFIQQYNTTDSAWHIDLSLSRATINALIKVLYHYDVWHHDGYYYVLCDQGVIRRVPDTWLYLANPQSDFAPDMPADDWRVFTASILRYGDVPITDESSVGSPAVIQKGADVFYQSRKTSTEYDVWMRNNFLYPQIPKQTDSKLREYQYKMFSPYSISTNEIKLLCVRENMRTIDLVTLTYHSFIDTWTIPNKPEKIAILDFPIIRI